MPFPDDDLGRAIFGAQLTAELNELYYRSQVTWLQRADFAVRVLAGVASSATVAGAFVTANSEGGVAMVIVYPAFKVLATLAAIAGIVNVVVDFAKRASVRRELAAQWSGLAGDYAMLRVRHENGGAVLEDFLRLEQLAHKLQADDTDEQNTGLIEKLTKEVNKRHGLAGAA